MPKYLIRFCRTTILNLLFILLSINGFSQYQEDQLLLRLAELRTKTLISEFANFEFIDSLCVEWPPISHLNQEEKILALYFIAYHHVVFYWNKDKMYASQNLKDLNFPKTKIDRKDIRRIDKCLSILSLMVNDYISSEYPYHLKVDSTFKSNLNFFNIQEGENIVDIGTGLGTDIWVLSHLYPLTNFVITELRLSSKEYLNELFANIPNVHFKLAKKKHTNLEGGDFDKIIIQNTFHHFSEKELMLKSIRKSLSDTGEVLLVESTYDSFQDDHCSESMLLEDINKFWENQGFILKEKQIIDQKTYLRYQH